MPPNIWVKSCIPSTKLLCVWQLRWLHHTPPQWCRSLWLCEQIKVWRDHVLTISKARKRIPLLCRNKTPNCEQLWPVADNFWEQNVLQEVCVVVSCHSWPCRHSLSLTPFWSYAIMTMSSTSDCLQWCFFGQGQVECFYREDRFLNFSSKFHTLVPSMARILSKNIHLQSHNEAVLLQPWRAALWSSVQWCGAHQVAISSHVYTYLLPTGCWK